EAAASPRPESRASSELNFPSVPAIPKVADVGATMAPGRNFSTRMAGAIGSHGDRFRERGEPADGDRSHDASCGDQPEHRDPFEPSARAARRDRGGRYGADAHAPAP